ncbi:MAG: lysophospholipid acyltransferase family protein [Desulfatibacillaceae bacterium]
MGLVRSVLTISASVPATIAFGGGGVVASYFTKSGLLPNWNQLAWAETLVQAAGLELVTSGMENADPSKNYIIVTNHSSLLDIPVVYKALPLDIRWLAKKELFRIPVFGIAMRRAGHISIDRGNRAAAMETLGKMARDVKSGVSVVIFPEGTRSLDGEIKEFKPGAFMLAMESGVPILPVVITGTYEAMPKGSLNIEAGKVGVRALPAVDVTGLDPKQDKKDLMDRVRNMMIEALEEERGKIK